ncbi:hypothetical protein F9278_18045 [Streptomyces phaeolivaceus]|uniref:Uncharacterized protein n=1 Tax=Streptomyces phaeolivaceus TaxID=2653200 RepID=A0A5P8K472_9ACTN|nr:hypothetical protein [Streptomyces phaeolivaceus]QFQ97810.1 hypothetical protein F9278_18045 [Streptomyces phaeolivaceus]
MSFEGFPVSGWQSREIPVHRPTGSPAILVARSRGPLTDFFIKPVIDTPATKKEDPALFQTFGTAPHMFVLPGRYTHVKVERIGRGASGVARWNLDRISDDALRPLKGRVTGTGAEVFTWRGGEGRLRFDFSNHKYGFRSEFSLFAFEDGAEVRLEREGSTRGTVTVPGPGFVRIQAPGEWKVDVA